jgi:hypothetical protein
VVRTSLLLSGFRPFALYKRYIVICRLSRYDFETIGGPTFVLVVVSSLTVRFFGQGEREVGKGFRRTLKPSPSELLIFFGNRRSRDDLRAVIVGTAVLVSLLGVL